MTDLVKLKERASEAFAKAKFSKAAELYEEYCKASPKDLQTRLRMGDAFARSGNKSKAIGAYQFAAENFAKEGFLPRAIAASKLILELDPAHQGVQQMLADLYARRGIGDGKAAPRKPAVGATVQVTAPVAPSVPAPAPAPVTVTPAPAPAPTPASAIVPPPPEQAKKVEAEKPRPAPAPEIDIDLGEAAAQAAPVAPKAASPAPEIEIDLGETAAPAASVAPKAAVPLPAPEIELDLGDGGEEISLDAPVPVPAPANEVGDELSAALSAEFAQTGGSASELAAALSATVAAADAPVVLLQPKRASVASLELDGEEIDLDAAARLAEAALEKPKAKAPSATVELPTELEIDLDAAAREAEAKIEARSAPAPVEKPLTPVAFELPRSPAPAEKPKSDSIELSLEDAPDLLETERPNATPPPPPAMPTRIAPGNAGVGSPPGLRRKPDQAPIAATPSAPAAVTAPPPAPATPATASAPAGTKPNWRGAGSELQASLEAFSKFDELDLGDAPIMPAPAPARAAPPPPAAPAPVAAAAPSAAPVQAKAAASFTELELAGDSLLHAVENAAQATHGEEALELEPPPAEAKDDRNLPEIPLFSDLPPDAFIALFERCPLKRLGMGEKAIHQGTVGDAFYVICEGKVRVVREDLNGERELATLEHGAFFGEMALLSGAPRTASVVSASDDTQLLEISAPVLADLSTLYPQVAQALKKFCRQRMLNNVMESSPLFRPFNKKDRRSLIEKFKAREVKPRDVVIHEGQRTDGLYVVLSGEMEVRLAHENRLLARLKEGDLFGEMSLLQKSAASASVIASKRSSLLRLPKDDFDALILSHPQILVLVSELTDDRRRQNAALLAKAPPAIPEGDEPLVMV